MNPVTAERRPLQIAAYGVGAPEKNPVFFEKRVYQGSSGKVYPVPFIDKVFDSPEPRIFDSVLLENEFVRLVLLPEIGGRIFRGQDKSNHGYDFFYRQDVIKPALVGLAGPWISGGVEFNWPQHHRPGTFLPADVFIEEESDGARTVWLSEHDPIDRLKGMHGVRLRPDRATIELRVRLYNRTPFTRTFLWWANVAARVHDRYQSFFPPDVHYVADHAVRAQSSFPVAENEYYGVDYASRPGANDLSWYRNIPVPTSYMVCESDFGFFGGYDHEAGGGFVHVANRYICPGKKQWTWGNHPFGWAWDRELTDENGPYIELMAGAYTDNQPDFSYLLPYETKTFSQTWWPYQQIGPVQNATDDAAVRLVVASDGMLDLGAVVSRRFDGARVVLRDGDRTLLEKRTALSPESPWVNRSLRWKGDAPASLELAVLDGEGRPLVRYRPVEAAAAIRTRSVATEPPHPEDTETIEELVLTAEHLVQYRHPTRSPELYWAEALRRDPSDARANLAFGRRLLDQGRLDDAAARFETTIGRLTRRHPNPYTGEAHYHLGLVRRFQARPDEAYAAFYKATWNCAWRAPAYAELAALDARRGDFARALDHCEASLDTNRVNNKVLTLQALCLRRLGRDRDASVVWNGLLARDPLDHWARHASGDVEGFFQHSRNDAQTVLDIAYDFADAGFYAEAIDLLERHHRGKTSEAAVPNPSARSALTRYVLAWLRAQAAPGTEREALAAARAQQPDYLFPCRLHDQVVLEWAHAQPGRDRNAAFGLGNYYFDRRRHEDAIRAWEVARAADPTLATVHRNLGLAYWNVRRDGETARAAYLDALENGPQDARVFYEFDQLRKKIGDSPDERLTTLLSRSDLVAERDDCTVELAALYTQTGSPERALALLQERRFHPWEGGEGQVLRQYTAARLHIGRQALRAGDAAAALDQFERALETPETLGEAYHLLQAKADVRYWTGKALRALGREGEAVASFEAAAAEAGDFQAMAVAEHSELSYHRGLALLELGRNEDARALFYGLRDYARQELDRDASIDYFATSLPLLLVFEDDLDETHNRRAHHLLDLAESGLRQDRLDP